MCYLKTEMSDIVKSFTRSTTDLSFSRGYSFERSPVVAPVVRLKYDVPKTPPHHIRYKKKLVLPVEHRNSFRLQKSYTFIQSDNSGKLSI